MKRMGGIKLFKIMALGGMTLLHARAGALPVLASASALVQDQRTGEVLMAKRVNEVVPIASLTKLVTTMVILDAKLDMGEQLTILEEDKDTLRHSRSRLPVGTRLTREQAMLLALMSSENRAAHALGRTYPGGLEPFIVAMNAKAHALGLKETHFGDPAGLSSANVASAVDVAHIVDAAHHYPKIRECTTRVETEIPSGARSLHFHNTNSLIESPRWQIGLSKTGFIDESGQCLVMQAELGHRPVVIVLLDAHGRHSRFTDANRIRTWMEGPDLVVARHPQVRPQRVQRPERPERARRPQRPRVQHRKHRHA